MMNQTKQINWELKHWQLTLDSEQVLWALLNKENASANTLDEAIFSEFDIILEKLTATTEITGLIIGSAKSSGFIAGANIEQFTRLKTGEEALALLHRGQNLFSKLEKLPIPTVAMINGFCLGGGLELALACRYRVADDSPKTKLGLPEVMLGIHPGWGGSVRLPKIAGAIHAMDLMLSGRTVNAKTAKKMGFIDAAVPKRQLMRAAKYYVSEKPKIASPSFLQRLTNQSYVRPLLAKVFKTKLAKKAVRIHYPAPYAVLDNWLFYGTDDRAYEYEAKSVSQLALTDTAKNLTRLFFLRERLKGLGKGIDFAPVHVHVIGAGTMGGDIAAWCALRGMRVTLQDREPQYLAPAIKRAYELFKKTLKTAPLLQEAMDRLIPDVQGHGLKQADVIIEAIYENLEAKQALFKSIEQQAKADAVLATNTSSIPLDEINTVLINPQRLVGIHFFNPVAKMQLVEVVKGAKTSEEVMQRATAFVCKIDRLPLQVASCPGFLVNRTLMPYLMEAMLLFDEGVPPNVIDQAALDFGMPMGPIELADTVGLDICLSVAKNLVQHFGGAVSPKLIQTVEQGQLGRKTHKGFYSYKQGKPVKPATDYPKEKKQQIADRLIMRIINESAACLRENIVDDAELLDAGMVFGTGFAPFRGGPMQYVNSIGKPEIRALLEQLQQTYGERFKPDVSWTQ